MDIIAKSITNGDTITVSLENITRVQSGDATIIEIISHIAPIKPISHSLSFLLMYLKYLQFEKKCR